MENFILSPQKDNTSDPIQGLISLLKITRPGLLIWSSQRQLICLIFYTKLIIKEISMFRKLRAKLLMQLPKESPQSSGKILKDSINLIKSIFITRLNSDSALFLTLTETHKMDSFTETLTAFSNKITQITMSFTLMTLLLTELEKSWKSIWRKREWKKASSKSRSTLTRKAWWRTFSMQ